MLILVLLTRSFCKLLYTLQQLLEGGLKKEGVVWLHPNKALMTTIPKTILCMIVLAMIACNKYECSSDPLHSQLDKNPTVFLSEADAVRSIYKKDIFVQTNSDHWLTDLGIDPEGGKSIVVNASNESISFGGGGLNGALTGYASYKGQASW